ncbi:hypothetical protein BI350_08440 [Sporosarcina ureilytica]|uniref:Gamma-type small acid-soluble spore protein n=1 Tax=Sporosarcina ureilytica TaxID=298596 RepID=A0A1D8JFR6_9BACL|nr:hypothetical protein BI350_08440 [Sporosarcina ureilytica]
MLKHAKEGILLPNKNFTIAGTNIDEVKKQNAKSGLSYNEVLAEIAKTGGKGTAMYSDTNPEQVRKANNPTTD